ncbi:MAG: 3-dehydroquinate synthase, partial [Gammaproteobacteria bacterium]
VGCGMVMAAAMSVRLGWLDEDVLERAHNLIRALRLPTAPPKGMTPSDFMRYMSVDKKVVSGQMRLVLLKSLGEAVVTSDFDPVILTETLEAFCLE